MFRKSSFTIVMVLLGLLTGSVWGQSVLSIPFAKSAPVVDGKIDAAEWKDAAVTSGFKEHSTGNAAKAPVTVYMIYNNSALFVAMECKGEPPSVRQGKSDERDSSVWEDSSVELFIQSSNWQMDKYAHFMVNHAGTIADEMCMGTDFDMKWDPKWQVEAGSTPDAYTVEMAIPWSILETTPKTGLKLRGNLVRNVQVEFDGTGEGTSWTDMHGGFHRPEYFGTFILAGNKPVVQVDQMPSRKKGRVEISAKLTDSTEKHTLSVKKRSGPNNKGKSKTTAFNKSGFAKAVVDIGFGTNDILVQVRNSSNEVVWQQNVGMQVPNAVDKLKSIKSTLKRLSKHKTALSKKYGSNCEAAVLVEKALADTESDIARLEAKSKMPLNADEFNQLMLDLDTPQTRVERTLRAVVFAEQTGKAEGNLYSFFVTNPVSTQKIMRDVGELGPAARKLRIAMMKNEYEPLQLVVSTISSDLHNVNVTATALTGPGGATIPSERLVITPVAYVNCKVQTPGATYKGFVPDVLMPYKPMSIKNNTSQPYFVTVHTTASDKAGEYSGKVTVSAEDGNTVDIPLNVMLYDVTLPVKSSLKTVFLLDWTFPKFLDGLSKEDVRINYSKTALEHRLSASSLVVPAKREDGTWDFSEQNRYIDELVPLGQTTLDLSRNLEILKIQSDHYRERGVWNLAHMYGIDEAAVGRIEEMQKLYQSYIDLVPDIKVMQTGWNPHPKLKNLVKIWCPLTSYADMKLIKESQAAGEEAWWYVCCSPKAPYANLFVDYPGIDHRILGWQTFQYGFTGFLYWGLDVWHYAGNDRPIDEYIEADYANWSPQSFQNFNGDGYLFYPGKKGTAVPSMRIALLRDGFEDYDMLNEAKELVSKAGKSANKLSKLIQIGSPISKDLVNYTQDGNILLDKREEILKEMERVQKAVK